VEAYLKENYTFHDAIENQGPFLRDFSEALIGGLLQPQDYSCNTFQSFIRELMATKLLSSVTAYANPYWVNYGLWCLPDLRARATAGNNNNGGDNDAAEPYIGPGYGRSDAQKAADRKLEDRLEAWETEKSKRMHDMEAMMEATFDLNRHNLAFDAMWDLKIEGIRRLAEPKPFVCYEICVRNGEYTWHLNKRYSDFKQLHTRLKRLCPGFSVKLPGQHVFSNNMNVRFIQKRRRDLQIYLQQLVWDRHVSESQIFLEFLVDRKQNIQATRKGHMSSLPGGMTMTRRVQPTQGPSSAGSYAEGAPQRGTSKTMHVKFNGGSGGGGVSSSSSSSSTATTAARSFKKIIFRGMNKVTSFWPKKKKKRRTNTFSLPRGGLQRQQHHLSRQDNKTTAALAPAAPASSPPTPAPTSSRPGRRERADAKPKHSSSSSPTSRGPRSNFARARLGGESKSQRKSKQQQAHDTEQAKKSREVGEDLLRFSEKIIALDEHAIFGHVMTMLVAKHNSYEFLGSIALDGAKGLLVAPNMQWIIRFIREYTWPEGKAFEAGRAATDEEIAEARREAKKRIHIFVAGLPLAARLILTPMIVDRIFEFLQIEVLLKHVLFILLEDVLLELFPELKATSARSRKR